MIQQQAAAMQTLQRRLDQFEVRQRASATMHGSSGIVQIPDPGEPRGVRGGGEGARRPPLNLAPQQTAGDPGTHPGVTAASGSGNQPSPPGAGTVDANPRKEAAENGVSPAKGNPPLPVLSANDRVQVTLSGQVNREILAFRDGSGRTDTYFADNNVSSTRLRVLGSARLDNETTAVSAIEFDLRSNSSGAVTRQSYNNNGGDTPVLGPFRVRRAEAGI